MPQASSPSEWVDAYLADTSRTADLERLVTASSGLGAEGILAVIGDPRLGTNAIHALSDLMRPEGSMYFDAIYGAFYGQVAIRGWLVPTMAEIDFIEFVPTQPTEVFEHPDGTASSADEWQMWARLGDERLPLPRGVSVRHYADGWITWNADVYDTGAFRVPPPEGTEAPPLPPPPTVDWATQVPAEPVLSDAALTWLAERSQRPIGAPPGLSHDDLHAIVHHPVHGADVDVVAALLHPDAVYLDPLFGDFTGRGAIHAWLADVMPKVGRVRFDTIGPTLFNGSCSVSEWVQMGVSDDGDALPMMRGTSVRRFADGWITYCADYFDTAVLADPAIAIAGRAAGSTLRPDDIARYRTPTV